MADRTRIKICGISDPAHAHAAAVGGADYVGLVFAPGSSRRVDEGQAAAVIAALADTDAEPVGLFMHPDDDPGAAVACAHRLGLGRVQLHGRYAQTLSGLEGLRVFAAIGFDPNGFADRCAAVAAPGVEAILVDTPDPSGVGGGTGRVFDHAALAAALADHRPALPVLLAGGLTAENVATAIQTVRPWGVDVSSGVERSRGVKDPGRIAAFCRAVRG